MKVTTTTRLLVLLAVAVPQVVHANVITDLFSHENDPHKIRLLAVVTASFGSIYLLNQWYLNSPRRIQRQYRKALDTYHSNKSLEDTRQYEMFKMMLDIYYPDLLSYPANGNEITSDIARLSEQESSSSLEKLKQQLIELQQFVRDVRTYFEEKKLTAYLLTQEQMYRTIVDAVRTSSDEAVKQATVKKIILTHTSSNYPYTTFESAIYNAIRDLSNWHKELTGASKNQGLLNAAQHAIQNFTQIRDLVLQLPEFRQEQRERALQAHIEGAIADLNNNLQQIQHEQQLHNDLHNWQR